MGIYVPLELISGILFILIALGQLLRPYKFRNLMFSFILFEMGYLHMLHMYIIYNRDSLTYYTLFPTAQPVFMSLGVFIYFYIRSIKGEIDKFTRKNLIHFIPALVSALFLTVFYIINGLYLHNLKLSEFNRIFLNLMFVISWISLALYIIVSINHIRVVVKKDNPVHNVFRQLMFLLILSFPAMITGIITSVMEWPKSSPLNYIYITINSFIIFGLFILMQRNPYLVQIGTIPAGKRTGKSASKSHLANIDIGNLKRTLRIMMDEEKLYCDEDISLFRLSQALNITTHQLSEFLNEYHNKNFNSYINSYRLRDAKKMLTDDRERSTLSIAFAVGFNSYSAFYTVFKKEINLSPAEYRKLNCS